MERGCGAGQWGMELVFLYPGGIWCCTVQRSEANFEVQASSSSDNYYILVLCSEHFVLESLGTWGCSAGSRGISCRFRICSAESGSWAGSAARQRGAAPPLGGTGLTLFAAAKWPGTTAQAAGTAAHLLGSQWNSQAKPAPKIPPAPLQKVILIIMVTVVTGIYCD